MFEHRYKEEKDNVDINNTTSSKKDIENIQVQNLEEKASLESNKNFIDDKPLKIETWADIFGQTPEGNTKNTPFQKFRKKYGQRRAYQYAFAYIMQKYYLYYDEKAGQFKIDHARLNKELTRLRNNNVAGETIVKKQNQVQGAASYYNHSVTTSKDDYLALGKNWAGAKAYRNVVRNGSLSDIRNTMSEHDPEYGKFIESAKESKRIQERIAKGYQKEEKIEVEDQNISFIDVLELVLATGGLVTSILTLETGIGVVGFGFALDNFQATARKIEDKYNKNYKSTTTYKIGQLLEKNIHGTTIIYDTTDMFFGIKSVKHGATILIKGGVPKDPKVLEAIVSKINMSSFTAPEYIQNHIDRLR
ncbi:MAG: hypothetical protein MUC49_13635 [Raineya sp.]|jgi:hypothetical protein|nr:hypothetical protein [Raineya sp.]